MIKQFYLTLKCAAPSKNWTHIDLQANLENYYAMPWAQTLNYSCHLLSLALFYTRSEVWATQWKSNSLIVVR